MRLYLGDCLDIMRSFENDSIDSLVTDPPAGISFMGKDWDTGENFIQGMTEIFKECLRVLKPGAHGLVWALPRTSHWTATALEAAGFEVRDVITHLFGQGFPKSLNISKAIDKMHGLKRKRIKGTTGSNNTECRGKFALGEAISNEAISNEAILWNGFGTALKPAAEFWVLVRKPLSEKTVVLNVLKHGCGGINIDGCRIKLLGNEDLTSKQNCKKTNNHTVTLNISGHTQETYNNQGRFPANLVLSHDSDCIDKCTDTCAVKMLGDPARFFYVAKISSRERNEGCKEVLSWEGQDQNLQELMDKLNFHLKDMSDATFQNLKDIEWNTLLCGKRISDPFPKGLMFTIKTVTKLIIELKTSNCFQNSNTKDFILGAIRTVEANGLSLVESVEYLNQFQPTTIDAKTESVLGANRVLLKTLVKIKDSARQGNIHSTVKPQKLMSYLCRLITPPKGVVLDCFMGSGSTGIAALKEGFDFIGIEREKDYFEIAEKRIDSCNQLSLL